MLIMFIYRHTSRLYQIKRCSLDVITIKTSLKLFVQKLSNYTSEDSSSFQVKGSIYSLLSLDFKHGYSKTSALILLP